VNLSEQACGRAAEINLRSRFPSLRAMSSAQEGFRDPWPGRLAACSRNRAPWAALASVGVRAIVHGMAAAEILRPWIGPAAAGLWQAALAWRPGSVRDGRVRDCQLRGGVVALTIAYSSTWPAASPVRQKTQFSQLAAQPGAAVQTAVPRPQCRRPRERRPAGGDVPAVAVSSTKDSLNHCRAGRSTTSWRHASSRVLVSWIVRAKPSGAHPAMPKGGVGVTSTPVRRPHPPGRRHAGSGIVPIAPCGPCLPSVGAQGVTIKRLCKVVRITSPPQAAAQRSAAGCLHMLHRTGPPWAVAHACVRNGSLHSS